MNKTKKNLVAWLVFLLLAGAAGVYFYSQAGKLGVDKVPETSGLAPAGEAGGGLGGGAGNPAGEAGETIKAVQTPPPANVPKSEGAPLQKTSEGTYSDGSEAEAFPPDVLVEEVVYDGSKFIPDSLTLKVGDIVIFSNQSRDNFWPASDPHPSHGLYPEFDAKKAYSPGTSYQFQFSKAGSFPYHDHLNPSAKGQVTAVK